MTKTESSNRVIPLTEHLLRLLQEEKEMRLKKGFADNNIVFCTSVGNL